MVNKKSENPELSLARYSKILHQAWDISQGQVSAFSRLEKAWRSNEETERNPDRSLNYCNGCHPRDTPRQPFITASLLCVPRPVTLPFTCFSVGEAGSGGARGRRKGEYRETCGKQLQSPVGHRDVTCPSRRTRPRWTQIS